MIFPNSTGKWLAIGLGVVLVVGGGVSIWSGYDIVQIERGWTDVIAGATVLGAGIVTIAIGLLIGEVSQLGEALRQGLVRTDDYLADDEFSTAQDEAREAPPAAADAARVAALAGPLAATAEDTVAHRAEGAAVETSKVPLPEPLAVEPPPAVESTEADQSTWQYVPPPRRPIWTAPMAARNKAALAASAPKADAVAAATLQDEEPGPESVEHEPEPPVEMRAAAPSEDARFHEHLESALMSEEPIDPALDWLRGHPRESEPAQAHANDEAPSHSEPDHPASAAGEEPMHEDGAPEHAAEAEMSPEATIIGRYSAQGSNYTLFSDGSIEAESPEGLYRFGTMDELRAHIEAKSADSAAT